MIRELSELGKKLREKNASEKIVHDALKDEPISIDLIIKKDGSFYKFETIEKILRPAEAITAKKGKARLLLDKAEEVIGYLGNEKRSKQGKNEEKIRDTVKKKHELFLAKLNDYKHVDVIKPVFEFYNSNKQNGVEKALLAFEEQVNEKERAGNIAFRIINDDCRIHEKKEVYDAIIAKYEQQQKNTLKNQLAKCSICGKNDYPIEDVPHGMIKRVPDGQTSGCALVSYNDTAYESYNLTGNLNSQICTACARAYVEGANWLLSNGTMIAIKDKIGKEKEIYKYTNRKNFGTDTAIVFWTRENKEVPELDLFDKPDPQAVANLIQSISKGDAKKSKVISHDKFYSMTLSGAAARIAVRDWIEMSLYDLQMAIATWFEDIRIEAWGESYYPSLFQLASCAQNEKSDNTTTSRIAAHLWKASIKGSAPPLWILSALLKRVRIMENLENERKKESITPDRAALIRLILNRNSKGGMIKKSK
ncbi:MAG: type I-C CRISPR-associated protein Cas8c/Csd1 [Spirochaetota bacterium]